MASSEVRTDKFDAISNKPIYRKGFTFTSPASHGSTSIATGLTGIAVKNIYGMVAGTFPINWYMAGSSYITTYYEPSDNTIRAVFTTGLSSPCEVFLEYTKN